jgi:excisionase family DNA binding protein
MSEPASSGNDMTVAETARFLQRSTEQIRRYLREGSLPGRRLGGQWFIQRAEAEAYRKQRDNVTDSPEALRGEDPDPLAGSIAVGGSGGRDIAIGRIAYLSRRSQEY